MNQELIPESGIAGRYISPSKDESGSLSGIGFHDAEHFNFAFDIVDEIAKSKPEKLAMLHISKVGKERRITFGDMMKYSNQTANYRS